MRLNDITSDRGIATIYLVAMITQFVYLEGHFVSPIKVGLMGLSFLLLVLRTRITSKAFFYGVLSIVSIILCVAISGNARIQTIGYYSMFVFTFILFYNLIYQNKAFDLDYFHRLVAFLIKLFAVTLVLQQIAMLLDFRDMPIINLNDEAYLEINRLPSLTMEPSCTARIVGCLYLAYCYTLELKNRRAITFKVLSKKKNIWVSLSFIYMILTMGSGTGFVVLAIDSLFLLKNKIFKSIPILITVMAVLPLFHITQLDRAIDVAKATMTGDIEIVMETDGSASSRVGPILNTIFKTDLSLPETWYGKGSSSENSQEEFYMNYADIVKTNKIATIENYGIISFVFTLLIVFKCCIRKITSIESLLFLVVLGLNVSNIAYTWGCLMIFSCIKYFKERNVTINE